MAKSFKEQLAAEIIAFQKSGAEAIKGPHLQNVYQYLLTIRPTSAESERVFSLAGLFASKLRPQLSDKVLDCLSFLRSYFTTISA